MPLFAKIPVDKKQLEAAIARLEQQTSAEKYRQNRPHFLLMSVHWLFFHNWKCTKQQRAMAY